ncbi:UNVERIFIED_CONTAM: hypothetical protein K2H54_003196 [Gekko kuhli]
MFATDNLQARFRSQNQSAKSEKVAEKKDNSTPSALGVSPSWDRTVQPATVMETRGSTHVLVRWVSSNVPDVITGQPVNESNTRGWLDIRTPEKSSKEEEKDVTFLAAALLLAFLLPALLVALWKRRACRKWIVPHRVKTKAESCGILKAVFTDLSMHQVPNDLRVEETLLVGALPPAEKSLEETEPMHPESFTDSSSGSPLETEGPPGLDPEGAELLQVDGGVLLEPAVRSHTSNCIEKIYIMRADTVIVGSVSEVPPGKTCPARGEEGVCDAQEAAAESEVDVHYPEQETEFSPGSDITTPVEEEWEFPHSILANEKPWESQKESSGLPDVICLPPGPCLFQDQTQGPGCLSGTKPLYKNSRHIRRRSGLQGAEATAFSMEGPTDKLSIQNEAGGEMETAGGATEDAAQFKSPKEPAPKPDCGPADKACAAEPHALCCPTATECLAAEASQPRGTECSASSAPHALGTAGGSQPSQAPAPVPCPPKASAAEMDCLICFNQYSPFRPPKLLACQHAFCAVCLKLLLRNEDHTWIITCPLCRNTTVVFGGLICSLFDKEDLLDRLDSPDPEAEAPCPLQPADTSRQNRWSLSGSQGPQSSRVAAKRLVLLLLLVVMLIAFILPFMYTGLLKLALCAAAFLGLLISAVLCCNPDWSCSDSSCLPWKRKQSYVVSVA